MTFRKAVVTVLQKTRLNRLAHKVYYNHVHGFDAATRPTTRGVEQAFALADQQGTLTRGDYYEFGLFKGFSFWWAQKTARNYNAPELRFFGFDSFEGLPEVEGRDVTSNDDFYKGQYCCSLDSVKASLDGKGVDWDRTFLTKGYFNESLTPALREQLAMGRIAIALIDCDLYSSTVDVLTFIEPMLMDGTILVFDDWNCFNEDNERGQRKAFAEFQEKHPSLTAEPAFSYGTWGQAFRIGLPA